MIRSVFTATVLIASVLPLSASGRREALLIASPSQVTTKRPVVMTFTLTAPEGGIAAGGGVRFYLYLKPWAGLMQGITDGTSTNKLVHAERSDGGAVEVVNVLSSPEWPILSDLDVRVRAQPLAAGETLTVQFGTDKFPVKATRKQRQLVIEAVLDRKGDGVFTALAPSDLSVRAGKPKSLHLVAPSFADVGKPVRLVAWAEDGAGNVCEDYRADLELKLGSGKVVGTMPVRPWPKGEDLWRNELSLRLNALSGLVTVVARDPATGLTTRSNPVLLRSKNESVEGHPERDLFWGDLHIHSQISDGKGEPEDVYRDAYARGHDFVALTDHSFGRAARGSLSERLARLCEVADRFNRPGKFVTIPAGETHYLPGTHMNLYFAKGSPARIERLHKAMNAARPEHKVLKAGPEVRAASVKDYWAALSGPDFGRLPLAFPHHTMWIGLKEFAHRDRMRVIEIHSTHGSSETRDQSDISEKMRMKKWRHEAGKPDQKYSVRELLADGYEVGFVGGSDSHAGQPGTHALTAVWTDKLTREAVLEAIHAQRCYATSGNRTLLQLRVDKDDAFLMLVAGDGPFDRVEMVHNGKVTRIVPASEHPDFIQSADWRPEILTPGYYYLRAILADGGLAWSSPVWIEQR